MTLAAACGLSLVRSLAVALAAWPVCNLQVAWLGGHGSALPALAGMDGLS